MIHTERGLSRKSPLFYFYADIAQNCHAGRQDLQKPGFGSYNHRGGLSATPFKTSTCNLRFRQTLTGTGFATHKAAMVADLQQFEELDVLAIRADWDWPGALRDIFRPRGINLLVAERTNDIVNVLRHRRICTTIIDTDPGEPETGLWTLKIIRMEQPLMPCILLASEVSAGVLEEALQLEVFSVVTKPVDMNILKDQLNRLFVKKYSSHLFSY
jgi:CheY-like chemotaxis protein